MAYEKVWFPLTIATCSLLWIRHKFKEYKRNPQGAPYPPGPRPLPLLENILDLPMDGSNLWEKAQEWEKVHGAGFIFIKTLGQPILFVNSYEAAVNLYEKHGTVSSSRPSIPMCTMEDWGWTLTLTPYGERLRRQREMIHRSFSSSSVLQFIPIQTQRVNAMLLQVIEDPKRLLQHIRSMIGATIMQVVYGYEVREKNDRYIKLAESGAAAIASAALSLVNIIPVLEHVPEWLPGAGFQKVAKEGKKVSHAMKWDLHNKVKDWTKDGKVDACLTTDLMEDQPQDMTPQEYEDLVASTTGVLFLGGSDTMVSVLHSFVLAMVLYPHAQERAQEELDRVLGEDNLPILNGKENLPYVNAVIKECLRWQVVLPLGSPRAPSEDCVCDGYYLPKETIIFTNAWAIARDSSMYPQPEKFIPERWLPSEGSAPPRDPSEYVFGFGRRICPGMDFAENMLFIAIGSLLATMRFKKALAEDGTEITPKETYIARAVRHVEPFDCRVEIRGKMESVVRQAVSAESM